MQIPRTSLVLALGALMAAAPALAQQTDQRAARQRQQQEQQRQEPPRPFPVGVSWTLVEINGRRPPVDATFKIDTSFRGTGFAGCNMFSAAMYPARGQTVVAGPPAVTKRACPPALMQFERAYLSGLFSRPTWEHVGDRLTLKTRSGVMRFRRGF